MPLSPSVLTVFYVNTFYLFFPPLLASRNYHLKFISQTREGLHYTFKKVHLLNPHFQAFSMPGKINMWHKWTRTLPFLLSLGPDLQSKYVGNFIVFSFTLPRFIAVSNLSSRDGQNQTSASFSRGFLCVHRPLKLRPVNHKIYICNEIFRENMYIVSLDFLNISTLLGNCLKKTNKKRRDNIS